MINNKNLRVLHAAVSFNPSLGVLKQLEDEFFAAQELGLQWDVLLHTSKSVDSLIAKVWPSHSKFRVVNYFFLRKNFHNWLLEVSSSYDLIVLRHSVHDVFER